VEKPRYFLIELRRHIPNERVALPSASDSFRDRFGRSAGSAGHRGRRRSRVGPRSADREVRWKAFSDCHRLCRFRSPVAEIATELARIGREPCVIQPNLTEERVTVTLSKRKILPALIRIAALIRAPGWSRIVKPLARNLFTNFTARLIHFIDCAILFHLLLRSYQDLGLLEVKP
jgi:hypothetical protein